MGNECCVSHEQRAYDNKEQDIPQLQLMQVEKNLTLGLHPSIVTINFDLIKEKGRVVTANGALISKDLILTSAQNIFDKEYNNYFNKAAYKIYLGIDKGEKFYEVEDWRLLDQFKTCPNSKKPIFCYALIKLKQNLKRPIEYSQFLELTLPCQQCIMSKYPDIKIGHQEFPLENSNYQPFKEQHQEIEHQKQKEDMYVSRTQIEQKNENSIEPKSFIIKHSSENFSGQCGFPIVVDGKVIAIYNGPAKSGQISILSRLVTRNMIDNIQKWSKQLGCSYTFQEKILCQHFQTNILILKKENTAEAALILENIAKGYYEEENYDSAIENHQKSLMIWQKLKGKESIEVAKVHFRIGNIQKDQKKYSKAIQNYITCLQIRKKIEGKDSIEVADCLLCIGNAHKMDGKYLKSLDYMLQSLQIRQKIKGKDSLDSAQALYNIGNVQYRQEDYANAIQTYKEAASIYDKIQPKHQNYAYSLFNLANSFYKLKNYKSAAQSFDQSLAAFKKLNLTTDLKKCALKLAKCLKELKDQKKLAKIIEIFKLDPSKI